MDTKFSIFFIVLFFFVTLTSPTTTKALQNSYMGFDNDDQILYINSYKEPLRTIVDNINIIFGVNIVVETFSEVLVTINAIGKWGTILKIIIETNDLKLVQEGKKYILRDKYTPSPEPPSVGPAPYSPKQPNNVPIISWVQAGGWLDAEDPFQPGQADEWVVTMETSSPKAFALVVHGDSMEPVFSEDDIITVDPDLEPRNHDYIVAKNGEEATLKQLVLDGSSVYLKPANARYPIKNMTGVDFVIVGVVVEKRKKFR